MNERKCKSCSKPGHPMTLFGASIGNYCHACYLPIWEKSRSIITPKLMALRDSATVAIDPVNCNSCDDIVPPVSA